MKTLIYGGLLYVFGVASAYFWNPSFFLDAIQEDGPVEYLTAFALLLMCVYIVFQVAFKGPISSKALFFWGSFALLCSIGFGEEISWGQRLLGVESSDFFKQHNSQQETNFHNLNWGGISINKLFSQVVTVGLVIYFFIFPIGVRQLKRLYELVDQWTIPVPGVRHTLLFFGATIGVLWIDEPKKWELWEAAISLLFFLIILDHKFQEQPHGK